MSKMRSFNITYKSTRMGVLAIKRHTLVAESQKKAIEGLQYWKGVTEKDVVSIVDCGEANTPTRIKA